MSIQSEINRIKNNLAAAYTAASEKGATMPSQQNSANLASTISSVSTAGGSSSRGFAVTVTGGTVEDMTFTANFTPREVLEAVLATENYSDLDITVSIGSQFLITRTKSPYSGLKSSSRRRTLRE